MVRALDRHASFCARQLERHLARDQDVERIAGVAAAEEVGSAPPLRDVEPRCQLTRLGHGEAREERKLEQRRGGHGGRGLTSFAAGPKSCITS